MTNMLYKQCLYVKLNILEIVLHKTNIDGAYKCIYCHLKTAYNELIKGVGVEDIQYNNFKD